MKKMDSTSLVAKYIDYINCYDREYKKWISRVSKIIKRYRDENRINSDRECKFNILWSNVQTLTAATFSRVPKPDVSRKFRDLDPVGRVAAIILERALDYDIQSYGDYVSTIKSCVSDRFLGGRATAWVRYEPHFRYIAQSLPEDGLQITEDVEEGESGPIEELDYECAPCDYVHWKDFGHSVARTWEEVTTIWRKVYLTREKCVERFGEEIGKKIPLDASSDNSYYKEGENYEDRSCIYEIWDKPSKKAIWISKSSNLLLDIRDDPLGLDKFFPCPKPIYATLTTDSLIPIPDFYLYQDQANLLDVICDRVDGLVKALKVFGVYDASIGEIKRLFTESSNTSLLPVTNWQSFAEKSGLRGSIELVDLTSIYSALRESYNAFIQIKSQVYEITGISDIVRGQGVASETATAQQIKGQFASLRLRSYQDEVSAFATELLQIKAQIICNKFSPQTILSISAIDQIHEQDKNLIIPALELLIGKDRLVNPDSNNFSNALRSFRVEVASDTLVQLDEQQEKQARIEFLSSVGGFLQQAVQAANSVPQQLAPEFTSLLMEMLKFSVTGFKVGKTVEGIFDEFADRVRQLSLPQPVQQPQTLQSNVGNIEQPITVPVGSVVQPLLRSI